MTLYVECGYVESGYIEGDEVCTGTGGWEETSKPWVTFEPGRNRRIGITDEQDDAPQDRPRKKKVRKYKVKKTLDLAPDIPVMPPEMVPPDLYHLTGFNPQVEIALNDALRRAQEAERLRIQAEYRKLLPQPDYLQMALQKAMIRRLMELDEEFILNLQ